MTNKEALKSLWLNCKDQAMVKEHDIISKDLEVLEIIKEHISARFLATVGSYEFDIETMSNEEERKILEWLDNGN